MSPSRPLPKAHQLRQAMGPYQGDFPDLLKRCMLYAIEHGPKAPGHGLLMGNADNVAMASQHYFASTSILKSWQQLLRQSFDAAVSNGTIAKDTDFEQIAAWSRRLVMSYILFPAPLPSVARDIERYVLRTLQTY